MLEVMQFRPNPGGKFVDLPFHTAITYVNGTCYVDLSSELNVQSAASIVVARNIRGRLLVNCRRIDDLGADDLRALTSLAARGTVQLTYVTPQLEETLLHACLATLVGVLGDVED
jgi:hypothetical protein